MRRLANPILANSRGVFRSCRHKFSTLEEAANRLKLAVHKEMQQEKEDGVNSKLERIEKYFRSAGWSVRHKDTQVVVNKKQEKYEISSFFQARTPTPIDDSHKQAKGEIKSQDYSETKVCIRRKDSRKIMIAHYCISSQHGPMLINIEFSERKPQEIESSEKLEAEEEFQGPGLNMLEFKIQQAVGSFLVHLGLTDQFLEKTSQYGLAYEQKFYIQWLRNLESLL